MNQGNPRSGGHAGDNGVWRDGGLMFWFPGADRWVALFLAFQSQSWHTDDRTGDPIPGKTGAEPAFDEGGLRLPAAERMRPPIDLVAVRVTDTPRAKPAILLLNPIDQNVALTGWSLATESGNRQSLTGVVPAGLPLAVDVPETFFDASGGVVALLDASGLKVAAATYPSNFAAQPGWNMAGRS
jgi:hypothetical protein